MSRRKNKAISLRLSMLMGIYLIICFAVAALIVIAIIWAFDYIEKDFVTKNYIVFFLICFASATIVGWGVMLILTSRINKEANNLRKTLSGIANGDYSQKYEPIEKYYIFSESVDDFNKMIDALNSMAVLQKNFASNFSHEFKTPIVSVKGYAELLMQNKTLSEEEKHKYLKIIIDESERLSKLASATLLISRLDAKKYVENLTDIRIDEQIEECVLLLDKEFEKLNIDVSLGLQPFTLKGNADLLKEVWINLLTNAIKYNREGGKISVKSRITESNYVISFSDTGIGMDEKEQMHAFDNYYQGNGAESSKGSGLGLSIARRIVELSGGEILLTSKKDVGSTFTVLFRVK